ncbi:DUF4003 family protein [Ornithinibacillus xuwenensis]|uniref:DUF4003 family protein n=1 Tax=Ornithinibacillus xuwenensis TaxID=3144668 RepID=A0ABU9XG19_9BACI
MNTKMDNYMNYYEELKQQLKWKVSDKRILMTISSIYVLHEKELRMNRFLDLAETIKRNASLFSSMRSYARFTTAAIFDVNFEEPDEKIQQLFDLYDRFREKKLSSGTYTYIAASILIINNTTNPEQKIERMKEIYDGMKKEHLFLTSSEDYPLATLLALEETPNIIQHIEGFYEDLSKSGFRKGNDLQFLSHILALGKDVSKNILISRAQYVMDSFNHAGIKPKTSYYPVIGMLALLPQEEFDMQHIKAMYTFLNEQKDFKWQKDMNVMMATSFFVHDKLDHKGLAETSLSTILEAILQAQQAVMIATIAASTAASNNNSGS